MSDYDTFNFGAHYARHEYPSGDSVQFGKGYAFSTKPDRPLQRRVVLHFETGLFFFRRSVEPNTPPPEHVTIAEHTDPWVDWIKPDLNILALDSFYNDKTLYQRFIYPHEIWGDTVVRFASPFVMPKIKTGQNGQGVVATDGFELNLIEMPE